MLALDLLSQTGDAGFAVDDIGNLVGWNSAASRLFGHRADDVLGRPCHAVLGCEPLGCKPTAPEACQVLEALRSGRPSPVMNLLTRHRSGCLFEVIASSILLPANAGARALILVHPTTTGVVDGPSNGAVPAAGEAGRVPNGAAGACLDLAGILDRLLITTGADSAELFLATPTSGELVLVMQRGYAPRSFRERIWFPAGQGFPGLVAQTREPIVSLDLAGDERYLRASVKRHGIRSYLCVPVRGNLGFLGSLQVAFRRPDDALPSRLPFLAQVAHELGVALELERLRAAEELASRPLDPIVDASGNFQQVADQSLQALIRVAHADCGALLLGDGHAATFEPASERGISPGLRRRFVRTCNATHCPAIRHARCILPGDPARDESPACRGVQRDLASTLCLPLTVGSKVLGLAVIGRRQHEPLPAHHLSFVHAVLGRVAVSIHNAQVGLREEQQARARPVLERPPAAPPAALVAARPPAPAWAGDTAFLDLRCFGRFTIVRDGRPVPTERFARRRSLTLLKILLTRYGKPVHREELIDLLWPEAHPQSGDALLNVVVHYLRRGLEPDAPAGQPSRFIATQDDYYAFDTESPHRADSQEFLQLVRLSSEREAAGDQAAALESCQQAIAQYAGDFLEDEPYSDWCSLEREYLRESFLTTLRRAGRLSLGRGDVEAAIGCYRRALLTDPTLEDVHRELMGALWSAGRRDEALRQYRDCCAILEREVGTAPLRETTALRDRIARAAEPVPIAAK